MKKLILLIGAVAAGGAGLGDKARQRVAFPMTADLDHFLRRLPAEHGVDRTEQPAVTGGVQDFFSVTQDADGDLGMGDRQPGDGGDQRGDLHSIALHKFHAGRGVIKQVADDDGRAVGTADFLGGENLSARDGNPRPQIGGRFLRCKLRLRYGGYYLRLLHRVHHYVK